MKMFDEYLEPYTGVDKMVIRDAAAHLLAVAEEWCKNNEPTWPCEEQAPRDLLDHLKSYIHGKQEA